MIAPKGPGHTCAGEYQKRQGVPALFAIHQDATAQARGLAMRPYAKAIGRHPAGILENQFSRKKPKNDLFGEAGGALRRPE